MSEAQVFRRGDVVLIPLPYVTDFTRSKVRPAVVVQNDIGNRFSSNVIVAAISSKVPSRPYPMHFSVPRDSREALAAGLDRDSVILAEVILTVPKASVVRRLGRFTGEAIEQIDECLRVSLALN